MNTYITVHVLARNSKNEYLVLQRAVGRSDPGTWDCITGYVKERESGEDAARRELKEETSLIAEIVKIAEPFWVDYGENRWVVLSYLVKVDNVGQLKIDKQESSDYKWISSQDAMIQKMNLSRKYSKS